MNVLLIRKASMSWCTSESAVLCFLKWIFRKLNLYRILAAPRQFEHRSIVCKLECSKLLEARIEWKKSWLSRDKEMDPRRYRWRLVISLHMYRCRRNFSQSLLMGHLALTLVYRFFLYLFLSISWISSRIFWSREQFRGNHSMSLILARNTELRSLQRTQIFRKYLDRLGDWAQYISLPLSNSFSSFCLDLVGWLRFPEYWVE